MSENEQTGVLPLKSQSLEPTVVAKDAIIPNEDMNEDPSAPIFNLDIELILDYAENLSKQSNIAAAVYLQKIAAVFEDSIFYKETNGYKQIVKKKGLSIEETINQYPQLAQLERKIKRYREAHSLQEIEERRTYQETDAIGNVLGIVYQGGMIWVRPLAELGYLLEEIRNGEARQSIAIRAAGKFLPQYWRKIREEVLVSEMKNSDKHKPIIDVESSKEIILRYLNP